MVDQVIKLLNKDKPQQAYETLKSEYNNTEEFRVLELYCLDRMEEQEKVEQKLRQLQRGSKSILEEFGVKIYRFTKAINQNNPSDSKKLFNKIQNILNKMEQEDVKDSYSYFWYNYSTSKYLMREGNYDKAEEYINLAIQYAENRSFKTYLMYCYNRLGLINDYKGNLRYATFAFKEALELAERAEFKDRMDYRRNIRLNLGNVFRFRGYLDKAIKEYRIMEELSIEMEDQPFVGQSYIDQAKIHLYKNEYENAKDLLLKCKKLADKEEDDDLLFYLLTAYIELYLQIGDPKQAKEYCSKLEELVNRTKISFYKYWHQTYFGIILTKSSRTIQRAKGLKILKNIYSESIPYYEPICTSLLAVIELYLDDMVGYRDFELINDIEGFIKQLYNIANNYNLMLYKIRIDYLKSIQMIAKGNIEEGKNKLAFIIQNADKYGYAGISYSIKKDLKLFENSNQINQFDLLKKFHYKSKWLNPAGVLESQNNKENQIAVFIMSRSGNNLYQKQFDISKVRLNPGLISGFLSAINSFIREIFDTEEDIDQIKHNKFSIYIDQVGETFICYICQGDEMIAKERVKEIAFMIQANPKLNNLMKPIISKIDHKTTKELDKIMRIAFE